MKLSYDKGYTKTFLSSRIEPWISGFLKSKSSLGKVYRYLLRGLVMIDLKHYNNIYLAGQ